MQRLVADLNKTYKGIPALWELDHSPEGFSWIDANDADNNVVLLLPDRPKATSDTSSASATSLPCPGTGSGSGLPTGAIFQEILNTDAETLRRDQHREHG